ncbi:COX15/CtaA family protein [Calditerricola satsumensis]|uniref:Heme A synthase n=1 Tax=Calditerricola satsumensis TaxID=373054 RepID=A0A8J3B2G3_9BACI|nr:COX15/CtaA family protein [Calditerricola satsumensis]GGJ91050.1 heme A synthase [Calditerricola satsumensis]
MVSRGLKLLAVATTIGMLLLLLGGALVTKTGSGDGCGDSWPLCNGRLFPPLELEAIIEWSHRLVTALITPLLLATVVWSWRRAGHIPWVRFFGFCALLTTFVQALLGAAAVVWDQSDLVMALHFGISLTAFASVLLIAIQLFVGEERRGGRASVPRRFLWLVAGTAAYTYVVVYLGALVRHTGSSMAIPDWPLNFGRLIPPLTGQIAIQFLHRVAALVLFALVVAIVVMAERALRDRRDLRWAGWVALVLTGLQVVSGGLVVLTGLNLLVALVHTVLVAALFGVLVWMTLQAWDGREARTVRGVSPAAHGEALPFRG